MADAGRRGGRSAEGNGWWTIYDPVEDLVDWPDDLTLSLWTSNTSLAPASAGTAFPPSVTQADAVVGHQRREQDLRVWRIATIVAEAAKGERAQRGDVHSATTSCRKSASLELNTPSVCTLIHTSPGPDGLPT